MLYFFIWTEFVDSVGQWQKERPMGKPGLACANARSAVDTCDSPSKTYGHAAAERNDRVAWQKNLLLSSMRCLFSGRSVRFILRLPTGTETRGRDSTPLVA